jgi:hypothetical protein
MTTARLREAARRRLDALPAEKVRVAAEFLTYLDERASDEATAELLRIPGLLEELQAAERELAAGRGTPVAQLRRKHKRRVSR